MLAFNTLLFSLPFLSFLVPPTFANSVFTGAHRHRFSKLARRHSWVGVPKGWVAGGAPVPGDAFELRIGLKQHRISELLESLHEVSQPGHNRYGQHLSKDEVDTLVAPHQDSLDVVFSWLEHHGISLPDADLRSSWLVVPVTVEQAERMLGTTYGIYHHLESSTSVLRTLSYSLPEELAGHVDVVSPTTHFGNVRAMKATNFFTPLLEALDIDGSDCDTFVTIDCLRAMYNTSDYVPTAKNNVLGVAGYLDEYASHSDLKKFLKRFRSDASTSSFDTVLVNNGKNNQTRPGTEGNLDIQVTVGLTSPGTPNIYYSTAGSPPFSADNLEPTNSNEPYLEWLEFILSQETIPQTITTSYGDHEQTVPYDYAVRVCNHFAELGARGSSVLFASGDYGVGGTSSDDCLSNDGTNTTIFQPMFPASCPYVTSVGATSGVIETASSFSGGGFSNYFSTPGYQTEAVANYVSSLGQTYSGMFNTTGRGFPDIAAQGQNFAIILNGDVRLVDGTSASSPAAAGVISLLNDYLISTNRSSLGFLNPLIYANLEAFNDITNGSNPGCGSDGFSSARGWDPVSGVGSADFKRLQHVVDSA